MLTQISQRVGKRGQSVGRPGGLSNRKGWFAQELLSKHGDEGKESQQGRCRAQHGQIRPWALRLDAQMGAHFRKGHFDRPTHDSPCQDLNWISVLICTPHGLRGTCALWITNAYPADRNRRTTSMVPSGSAGRHLG